MKRVGVEADDDNMFFEVVYPICLRGEVYETGKVLPCMVVGHETLRRLLVTGAIKLLPHKLLSATRMRLDYYEGVVVVDTETPAIPTYSHKVEVEVVPTPELNTGYSVKVNE